MGDCLWFAIGLCDVCDGSEDCESCEDGCKYYLPLNSLVGRRVASKYAAEVEVAVRPVRDKYGELMAKVRRPTMSVEEGGGE